MKIIKLFGISISIPFFLLCLSSCVNPDYDLSKPVDTTMTLLKNVTLPVGDLEPVKLSEIIDIESQNVILLDSEGNYYYEGASGTFSENLSIPEFSLQNFSSETASLDVSTGDFAGITPVPGFSYLFEVDVNEKADFSISSSVPEEIIDLKEVTLYSNVVLSIEMQPASNPEMSLCSGTEIVFPDYLTIEKANATEKGFEIKNQHIIQFTEDQSFGAGKKLTINLLLTHMDIPAGALSNNVLNLSDEILVQGKIKTELSEYSVIPSVLNYQFVMKSSNLKISGIVARYKHQIKLTDKEFIFSSLPEFFSGDDSVIDFYNPQVIFSAHNPLPVDLTFEGKVSAYKGSDNKTMTIDPIVIKSSSNDSFCISAREVEGGQFENIVNPDIANILNIVPEKISISGMTIKTVESSEYQNVVCGQSYDCSMDYKLFTPLSFGEKLSMSFEYDIEDIELSLVEPCVQNAKLMLTLENSVPLSFDIDLQVLDSNSKPDPDITVKVESGSTIHGGSLDSPSVTDAVVSISAPNDLELSALRLKLKASVSPEYAGICLNEKQTLTIKNLAINLPDGIEITSNSEE